MKVLADVAPSEGFLPNLQTAASSLRPHVAEGEEELSVLFL